MGKPDVMCRGCDQRKPSSEFDYTIDGRGAERPRKQCRVCNGVLGHKPCYTCKVDQPINNYALVCKPFPALPYPRRDCHKCIYQQRLRNRSRPPKKRGPVSGVRIKAVQPGRPGWTPPPSAEELAAIHSRYQPPAGWSQPWGERSA